ncbi:hypothetical protein M3212_13770 [Alkalihalobacillus oceani]|uniref:hypothetical protein n=1 Tax=Halalkalibacter oceani TaxID=1653776 RepID=UPI00203B3B63|nr:hypothetical protein [Halalkalibacter oceani]MCM3761842.1 hypothetical protein [Halalkalibacter oceani]
MGESVLKASIKKIEIVNKTKKDEWQQSIRIILGDIELNNDNFIALRRFRPDEIVRVSMESEQMSLFDSRKKTLNKKEMIFGEVEMEGEVVEEVDVVVESDGAGGEVVEREFEV